MHTTRMRCVLAGVLASALVGGAQAGLFGGGGNGGGGFDSGPAMGGGGFEAPTNMLGYPVSAVVAS